MKKNPSLITKILLRLKPLSLEVVFSVLFALIIVIFTLYIPVLVGNAIDLLIDKNTVDFSKLGSIIIQLLICLCIISLCQWSMSSLNNKITFKVSEKMRNDAVNKIQKLPLSFIDKKANGEIVSIAINDVDSFVDGLLLGFSQLFTGILTIVGTLIIMIKYNWIIAIVVFVLTPMSIFVAKFIASKIYSTFKKQAEIKGIQTGFIEEMINQQKIVQAYSHQKENEKDFEVINNNLKNIALKANFYSSLTNPITRFLNALVYAAVAIIGAYIITNNLFDSFSIGMLTTMLSYASQYSKPFNEISAVITELQNSFACANRIFNLLEQEEMEDETNKKDVALKGNVTIENVFFSYDIHKPLIENFNIEVKAGEKIAIVGPTGCGKTTMINLLMDFYQINSGRILFDGIDIKEIKPTSLRSNIGMVLQETWLKSGTIRENICFGKDNATNEEIERALVLSHCKHFVDQLPNKLDTDVNEDGGSISAGQKQLLCIARLMLLNPSILILDEATSNIDTRTEIKIQEAFNTLMKGKTSFIVAHRLSTIQNADKIIVMNHGKVVEIGNHEELLKKKGFYENLYMSQFNAIK